LLTNVEDIFMSGRVIVLFTLVGLLLAGCTPAVTSPVGGEQPGTEQAAATQPDELPAPAAVDVVESTGAWPTEAQTDQQGAVTVVIKPLNLAAPGDSLDFEVILDTHSVDLSMDLAELATLTDGDGREVHAMLWDAARGGHHVSGTLSFPVTTAGGEKLLVGASQLTLIIRDVGVAERRFVWQK
jgi:hypothetical protein